MLSPFIHLHRRHIQLITGLAGLYALAAGLLAISWRRWPDVIVDFGRELYVPWRMVEGDSLYLDIAYFNGPLSPYVNSTAFSIFGTSVTTIVFLNCIILLLLTTLLYFLLNRICQIRTALVACVVFLIGFAFSHTSTIGNYNYICPYSHEMTHGIFLTFCMLTLLFSHYIERRTCQMLVGLLWGCVFLGKAELFVASSAMLIAAYTFQAVSRKYSFLTTATRYAFTISGALLPVIAFYFLLRQNLDIATAGQGIAGTWYWIFNSDVTSEVFYDRITGTDQPIVNLINVMISFASVVAIIFCCQFVEQWRDGNQKLALAKAIGMIGLVAWLNDGLFPLVIHARALPIIAISLLVFILMQYWKTNDVKSRPLYGLVISWTMLGGALLLKMPLNSTMTHYGFVLAMPMTILAVAICLEWLPSKLCGATGGKTCFNVLCLLIVVDLVGVSAMTATNFLSKSNYIGQGNDVLYASKQRGAVHVADALRYLTNNTNASDTVVVLPEGVMINYMTRRASSTQYVNLCPPELAMYGEANIRQTLANDPSDWIVLVNKDVREYGRKGFGDAKYGEKILDWVMNHYQKQCVFGSAHSAPNEHGITILRRQSELVAH